MIEFRVQAEVIDLVLCPTCGHWSVEAHIKLCVLPAPVMETGTKLLVTEPAPDDSLDDGIYPDGMV